MRWVLLSGLLCSGWLVACGWGPDIQHGITLYRHHDYPSTAKACAELAPHVDEFNDKGRVRYLVYCGLNAYHLDDRKEAEALLRRGHRDLVLGDPLWLDAQVTDEMNLVIKDLRQNPGH